MGISGKCDLQDFLSDITDFSKIKIHACGHELIPLRIDSRKDVIPYYPYLVAIGNGDKDGNRIMHISSESFIDCEEKEWLTNDMNRIKKYYRKCKRNKLPFDDKEAKELIWGFLDGFPDYKQEIIDRVKEYGEKATIDGIHDRIHENMRKQLYDLMIKEGWEEPLAYRWVYGWSRYLKRCRAEKYGDHTMQEVLNLEEDV